MLIQKHLNDGVEDIRQTALTSIIDSNGYISLSWMWNETSVHIWRRVDGRVADYLPRIYDAFMSRNRNNV